MKDIEVMKSLEGISSDGTSAEAQCMSFSPKRDCENSNKHFITDGRKEKSLGLMSLKFLMLFLTTAPKVLNLDLAAKVLIGNSNSEILNGDESIKFKTKVRRLYDIANILSSLGLIQKVYVTELRGRKPAFQYIGPDLKDFEEDGIECENFLSLQSFMNENSSSSSVQNDSENSHASTSKREAKSKLTRHASLQDICEVAELERVKMFSDENKSSFNIASTFGVQSAIKLDF
ncbi:transcription factor E2F8-like [Centruroides sculpturatus]|uniref:transcription factor E2F8-like n=1 Tax=Centruroides sculpturatus TaxID=218467 RepID=UPI000C6D1003|nr:transcription factor E2F8-like [Centruroides sculpturatus]